MILAYEAGVNFFDNAETYAEGQSEVILSKVLRYPGWSRDIYIVSSKVHNPRVITVILGASRKEQLVDNLAALKNRKYFDATLLGRIEEIVLN